PLLVADEGDAVDLRAVGGGELDVVPQGVQVPAVEVVELGQQPDLALLGDGGINHRNELLVVLVVQLAGHLEAQDLVRTGGQLLDHQGSLVGGTVAGCAGNRPLVRGRFSPILRRQTIVRRCARGRRRRYARRGPCGSCPRRTSRPGRRSVPGTGTGSRVRRQ